MNTFIDVTQPAFWVLIASICVLVVVIGVFLFFGIRGSQKKKVAQTEKRYLQIKNTLTGQDSSYISRLEKIARMNLLYSDIYEEYLKQFKLMIDGDCKYIESDINILKECLKNNKDNFRKVLLDAKKAIAIFKEKVTNFDNSLRETIQPEENSRLNLFKIKEEYRSLKSKYLASERELQIVEESVKKFCDKIDESFTQFEDLVEKAEYDEANTILPTLNKVILSLNSKLDELPGICTRIERVIPDNIKDLGSKIREKEEMGVPTYVLGYNKKVYRWNDDLKSLKQAIKDFKFADANKDLDRIQEEIESTYKALDKELEDKIYFENNFKSIFASVDEFEKGYEKFLSKMPKLNEVYTINIQKLNDIELLKESANQLGTLKRGLDSYLQSGIKQPYSTLKTKLDEIEKQYTKANAKLEDVRAYFADARNSSQDAYNLLFEYYNRLRDAEAKTRAINSSKYYKEFNDSIDSCYNLLNDLNSSLHAKPLNLNSLYEDIKDLKTAADPLLAAVEEDYKFMCLAESAIVYTNRDRDQQSDVHERLKIIENKFHNCEFDKAYQEASELYKNKHIGE